MKRGYAASKRMQHVAILITPTVIHADRKVSLLPAFSVRVRDDIVMGSYQNSRRGASCARNTIRKRKRAGQVRPALEIEQPRLWSLGAAR